MFQDGRRTLAIGALFVGSGCAALVYEIVWFQLLTLVIGASAVSLALLLASFMGGMCFGSLAWPRLVSPKHNPLRMYALLEFLIGGCGLLLLWLLPKIGDLYWPMAGHGSGGVALRAVTALLTLLPPTFLMGATLPAVARWVKSTQVGLSQLGWFYGANTFGAVLGTLLAGFVLLPYFDVHIATLVAVSINIVVAGIAWTIADGIAYQPAEEPVVAANDPPTPAWSSVHFVIALSGLTALGAEVVWTRMLSLLFGATAYTFSILLAVFLIDLGFGSAIGAWLARRVRWPAYQLACCQAMLALAIPFGAYMIAHVLPSWLADRGEVTMPLARMLLDLIRAAAAMLPATLLWGASFPLAVATAGQGQRDTGKIVGKVYAFNTLGAIIGSAAFSLGALPNLGSQLSQQVLTLLAAASGVVLMFSKGIQHQQHEAAEVVARAEKRWGSAVAVTLVIAFFLSLGLPHVPKGMLAFGRLVDRWDTAAEYLYVSEGLDAAVVVTQRDEKFRDFHVSGKVVASNDWIDLRIERMLGHLPAMAHKQPKTALVVGCGAGVAAGSLLMHPSIERVVICEIEANVPKAAGKFFAKENYGVIDDPRVTVIHDDARHFLVSTDEKFDVITADPIHPWVRGAAALYTTEFLDVCSEHLAPGGVMALWVPLYETNEAAVQCEVATFLQVYPDCTIWSSEIEGGGYDVVLLGSNDNRPAEVARLIQRARSHQPLLDSLAEVQLGDQDGFLKVYAGEAALLNEWLRGAPINRDSNLRLQYLAGWSIDSQRANEIFGAMAHHVKQYRSPIALGNRREDGVRPVSHEERK